jgi:hypothetical protein
VAKTRSVRYSVLSWSELAVLTPAQSNGFVRALSTKKKKEVGPNAT